MALPKTKKEARCEEVERQFMAAGADFVFRILDELAEALHV